MYGAAPALTSAGTGVGTWFLGQWFNQVKPVQQYDLWFARRRDEVAQMVRGGAYANVPDPQRPGQVADPWSVGEYVLQQEGAKVKSSLTNPALAVLHSHAVHRLRHGRGRPDHRHRIAAAPLSRWCGTGTVGADQ